MPTDNGITQYFGENLAEILADKILTVQSSFNKKGYVAQVKNLCQDLTYTQRIQLHAELLKDYLSDDYTEAVTTLVSILGPENKEETGMFKNFYWVMPIGKFVELYGLDDYKISIDAIEEITKRNTGEYAIRPYIRKYPKETIKVMTKWAKSKNFHLRRLASEGLRPKLPWAPKLDTYLENPAPVFKILDLLKEDDIKFVKKSVGNHLTDYLKVNPEPTLALMSKWKLSDNIHTQWILKHANRKLQLEY